MSSRLNRRQGNSQRSGRSGGGRGDRNGPSGRRYSSGSSSSERGTYRSRRNLDDRDKTSGASNRENFQRGSFNSDLRDDSYTRQERSGRLTGSTPRRFNKENQVIRTGEERRGRRFSLRERPRQLNTKDRSPRFRDETLNSFPESEVFGGSLANDLIWGRHATQAALEAGRPIHRIWCTAELRSASKFLQLLREAKSSGVLVEEVSWARLGQLTSGAVHQGIVLQVAAAQTLDLKSLIEGCSSLGESPLLLALDGLTDPQNLGAIVRSAEALGAHGLVLPQRRSAGLTGSVAKVAAGALEHLPVARVVNLNRSLETLKSSGYRVIGLAEQGDLTLSEVDLEGPLVVVTGSENQGISLVTRRHCDQLVRIPLRGVTTSLNASVATAMFLYEVARRNWMKGIRGQSPSPKLVRAKSPSSLATIKEVCAIDEPQEKLSDGIKGASSLGEDLSVNNELEANQNKSEESSFVDSSESPSFDMDFDENREPFEKSIDL